MQNPDATPIPFGCTTTRPFRNDSLSHLLHTAKKELQDITLGERCVIIGGHVV